MGLLVRQDWECCARSCSPLFLLFSFSSPRLRELQRMNAVERKESETPSTPCSPMTPSLEASQIGVSTTASTLSLALRNPSSALRGENCLLNVRTMGMGLDTDTDTDMDMDTARKLRSL